MRNVLRRFISENAAKTAIFVLFLVTLLVCIIFWWEARALGPADLPPAALDYLELQQQSLEEQAELGRQLSVLEEKLTAARQDNEALGAQNDALNQAQVELLDSMTAEYVGVYYATAYCCERYPHICGGNGVTASGTVPTPGLTVAADWNVLPAGTWLYIEGVGLRRVEDRGSAIKGQRLDIAIDTHANALRWSGQGNHHTWVLHFDDGSA